MMNYKGFGRKLAVPDRNNVVICISDYRGHAVA
jgi:hypothetical protein